MIDAEFRSEERFSRLSLAYKDESEKLQVHSCVEKIIAKHNMKPEMHTTSISNGREVLVVEYHDDNGREAGEIFEAIMKALEIKECI
ncbi:hypothetical protein [Sulfurimonas sp.]|uniref:hypothetical protein n=1 Tax=Sulfurimonas sp. TaxID=2022749 RepID=UPI003565C92E